MRVALYHSFATLAYQVFYIRPRNFGGWCDLQERFILEGIQQAAPARRS